MSAIIASAPSRSAKSIQRWRAIESSSHRRRPRPHPRAPDAKRAAACARPAASAGPPPIEKPTSATRSSPSASRKPARSRTRCAGGIAGPVVGRIGEPVPARVIDDDAIVRAQRPHLVKPHALAAGEAMKQDDRQPASEAAVVDADVANLDACHDPPIRDSAAAPDLKGRRKSQLWGDAPAAQSVAARRPSSARRDRGRPGPSNLHRRDRRRIGRLGLRHFADADLLFVVAAGLAPRHRGLAAA